MDVLPATGGSWLGMDGSRLRPGNLVDHIPGRWGSMERLQGVELLVRSGALVTQTGVL